MQITGPTQIVFPDGVTEQNLSLGVSGAAGAVAFTVTQVPAQVAAVRKSPGASPLASGAVLTSAEAANLVVTRSGGSATYGPTISAASVVGVRSRVYANGAPAPAFTVGDAAAVQAVKDGNFWLPAFPTGGTGTLTVEILLDLGTAITLGKLVDTIMSLNYGGQATDQWQGVTARALSSSDGSAVSVLDQLSIVGDAVEPNSQKRISGFVTGAASARWVGLRLLAVPRAYPCIFQALGVQAQSGSSASPTLPSPVYFGVSANEASGASTPITAASAVEVRSRVFATGATPPAFAAGTAPQLQALKDGNYWIPNFPTGGAGTLTVDLMIDAGSPITLSRVADIVASLNYGGQTTNQWAGVTAKALTSSDGSAVVVLDALAIAADNVEPNGQKRLSGNVTGAPAGRWAGIRLENVSPTKYPCIFKLFNIEARSGTGAAANHVVAIGDTGTNFGTPPGSGTTLIVYGDPGTRFPLDIYLPTPAASYVLTIPSGLALVERVVSQTTVTRGSSYAITNATGPFVATQSGGGVANASLSLTGSGTFAASHLTLASGAYLSSPALGINATTHADPAKTQTPVALQLDFTGVVPANSWVIASVYSYYEGGIILMGDWAQTGVGVRIERDGVVEEYASPAGFSNTISETASVRYTDNPNGAGGTLVFLRNGVQVGSPITTGIKPRITPNAALECNALTGNPAAGGTVKVASVGVKLDMPSESYSYVSVSSGAISAARLQNLYVDASTIGVPQSARTVTYQATGGSAQALDVVIGPLVVPAGAAYRAVLENWTTGSAVNHPNALVMTKPARQNCRFEDTLYGADQTPWTECLPQGAPPVINGIAYYCEAIRMGSYVQFQFGYDWAASAMPANPFGDPTGLNSYMVPHKWRIEDQSGNMIARVQRPDGGALNGTDVPHIFAGSFDGNGAPITNTTNKWYPHGTVRSAVVWRSSDPASYDQATISARLPRYDLTVPYAQHTHYSSNGGDLRLTSGAQMNGFGATRVMPFEPTNYAALTSQAGVTQDPHKGSLYSAGSLAAVASTWLRYTPFNQMGRSPLTGPGGTRDDRAAIPEPVAQYMYDVALARPHDGKPWKAIALDFVTGYASDPYHCFEQGRCVPLFKGANANRSVALRNHYYGYGEGSIPSERAYYIQSGREYDLVASMPPFRTFVPSKGSAGDKPYFGTNAIDAMHAHQYPHWGSLLWKTPEFAIFGHKLWDQFRLYGNYILAESSAFRMADREGAWGFLHAALAWKTASANSDRLYSRAEVIEFVKRDFEWFHDNHKTSTPGFDTPPTNLMTDGQIDPTKVFYAGASRFGLMGSLGDDFGQHDFSVGYWLTALGIGERLGFNAAVRASSTKASSVLSFLIAKHRQRIVGRINNAPRANVGSPDPYAFNIWRRASILAAGGAVASLPQTYAAVNGQNGTAASWDVTTFQGSTIDKDGQAMDQLISGPSILKLQLAQTGSDLDSAQTTAQGWRNAKKAQESALGANAGSSWFKYLNAVNNPALS